MRFAVDGGVALRYSIQVVAPTIDEGQSEMGVHIRTAHGPAGSLLRA